MLILFLTAKLVWAAGTRATSGEVLRAACLRSEVHAEADKRRLICDCIAETIRDHRGLSDADVAYLAKTWAEPGAKIDGGPAEADVLEDYDEDVMESCILKYSGRTKDQSRKNQK